MASTNVSCFVGDDTHITDLLKILAAQRGTKVGRLVRDAIDAAYGDELESLRSSFFADDCAHTHNSERKHTKKSRLTS